MTTMTDFVESYRNAAVLRLWGPTFECSCGLGDYAGRLSVLNHVKHHRKQGESVLIARPDVDDFPELRGTESGAA